MIVRELTYETRYGTLVVSGYWDPEQRPLTAFTLYRTDSEMEGVDISKLPGWADNCVPGVLSVLHCETGPAVYLKDKPNTIAYYLLFGRFIPKERFEDEDWRESYILMHS